MTATRKLVLTALMFAIALSMVAVSAATHVVAPLFAAWAPLLAVPYMLTRPEPGNALATSSPEAGADTSQEDGAVPKDATDSG